MCGAEPGDILQVDILDLMPRKNPKTGKVCALTQLCPRQCSCCSVWVEAIEHSLCDTATCWQVLQAEKPVLSHG